MDPESIKSLLSFLLWGGLFFLMMRFGMVFVPLYNFFHSR